MNDLRGGATHFLHAFGHQIHPRSPWHVLGIIFIVATTFAAVATRQLVGGLLRRPPDVLIRGASESANVPAAVPALAP